MRDVCSSSPTALLILLSVVDCSCFVWTRSCKLLPDLQLQILWLFSRQIRVCSFFFPPQTGPDSCRALFECVMTDDVSFEWGYASYSQVFSCKQFGDFFLDRWKVCLFFILPQKVPTAVKHILFYFIDDCWCLIWMSFYKWQPGLQLQTVWWYELTKCLPSCKSDPQVLCTNATVLSLSIQVLVYAGCSCQCQDRGLAGPPTVSRKVPKKLAVSSSSCWFLKGESKVQSSTFSWVLSGDQRVVSFSALSPSPNHRQFLESSAVVNDLLICQRWIQFPVIHKTVSPN